jgi:hypothetical protein
MAIPMTPSRARMMIWTTATSTDVKTFQMP